MVQQINSNTRAAALDFLYSRIDYERAKLIPYQTRVFKLERMRRFLSLIGDPHKRYPAIHIAGTKGKGSTAACLAAILAEAGYRTGLYTSPHLSRPEERIQINGRLCPEEDFAELVLRIRPVVYKLDSLAPELGFEIGPTYFEILTAVAMMYFAEMDVDVAVLEVGLGGRLDATNVCQPVVTVITNISLDHVQQLGHSLKQIAWEKAGIIKQGIPLVSGVDHPEARSVIASRAEQLGATLYQLGEHFSYCYRGLLRQDQRIHSRFDFIWETSPAVHRLENLALSLLGRHQVQNASLALACTILLQEAGWKIPLDLAGCALQRVSWPARVEVINTSPMVVLDGAHNRASIEALLDTLRELSVDGNKTVVFGTSEDKDVEGMLEALISWADRLILTQYSTNPRFIAAEKLLAMACKIAPAAAGKVAVEADAKTAVKNAVSQLRADDLLCVTGSFYLAAEVRPILLEMFNENG